MSLERRTLDTLFEQNPEYAMLAFDKLRHIIPHNVASDRILRNYIKTRNDLFAKKHKQRVFFRIVSKSYTWQIDLMLYQHRIFFVAIEINSRFGFIEPLKRNATGTVREWLPILQTLINLKNTYCIMCDDQFAKSRACRQLCDKHVILLQGFVSKEMHKYPGNKLGFVDRFTRTLKWYDLKMNRSDIRIETRMQKIVDLYNKSPHSSLHMYTHTATLMTPIVAFEDPKLLIEIYVDNMKYNWTLKKKLFNKFAIGDRVRHLLPKDIQAFRPKEGIMFSKRVFKVDYVGYNGYHLVDEITNEPHARVFKPNELQVAYAPVKTQDPKPTNHPQTTKHRQNHKNDRRETRQRVNETRQSANASKPKVKVGTRVRVIWLFERQLKWFKGTIKVVHPTFGRDADGTIIYVDVEWDDGIMSKNFKLFEDYYDRSDVESAWRVI